MEATDGSAGDGNEKAREDGLAVHPYRGTAVLQSVPELGDGRPFDYQSSEQAYGHEYEREGEYGVNLADDFVNGEKGGYEVVCHDDDHPYHHGCGAAAACHPGDVPEDDGRTVHEHGPDQHKEQDDETQHQLLDSLAKIHASYLGQVGPSVPEGEHT